MPPIRTADGDPVGRTAVFFDEGSGLAAAGEGSNVAGPIRTPDGDLVGRTALYTVADGVAAPLGTLGVNPDTVGQPGGPAGPLDANGEIPLSQMPIDGLNYQGAWDASTNTPTLADGVGTAGDFYRVSTAGTQDLGSGPLTFQVGDHVIYEGNIWQQLDAAQVIDWGDIQGDLANQADLQAALDAKADATDVPTAGNPTSSVGLTAANGTADTWMRSDAAPPLDQSIAPTWTGAHEFQDAATFTAAAAETAPSIGVASGNPQLDLQRTSSATDEKRWNIVVDPDQLVLRALTDAGDVADNAWILTRSGGTVTAHSFHVGGDAYLSLSTASDIVAFVDLHMSEQKVVNIADGTNPRDAVNRQQLDGKLAPADVVGDNPVTTTNELGVVHVALAPGGDGEALVTLGGVPTWGNQTANAVGALATTELGQPNGVASLGADGIVPADQLPGIQAPADQTADATLQNQHPTVQLCDATAAAINLNLVADTPGKTFTIKKTDASANTVTISPPVPIDGQGTAVLTSQYDYITIVRGNSDNWHIISQS